MLDISRDVLVEFMGFCQEAIRTVWIKASVVPRIHLGFPIVRVTAVVLSHFTSMLYGGNVMSE